MSIARRSPHTFFGSLFGGLVVLLCLIGMLLVSAPSLVSYLLSINLVVMLAYGYDKLIAGSSMTRVPEKVLHTLSLAGGSPGALMAQRLFRHKTLKKSFQVAYWLIVLLQLAILAFVFWQYEL